MRSTNRDHVALEQQARLAVYAQVCDNYRAIDDLRLRLLALLPLATGTGILVLLGSDDIMPSTAVPAAIFGIIATLALFAYELHGIEKCHHFIVRGQQLEAALRIEGSFTERPKRILKIVNELLAAALIYPASLAGWTFVLLYPLQWRLLDKSAAYMVTTAVLVTGIVVAGWAMWWMEHYRGR